MTKFFKKLNRFFASLRMTVGDQKGIIHLIPLLLIMAGIIAGVILIQNPQILKPKATAKNIEISAPQGETDVAGNACRTYADYNGGVKLRTNCAAIDIKFISPLETQTSSDNGFQLIKTAYAQSLGGVGFVCEGETGLKKPLTSWVGWPDQRQKCPAGEVCKADGNSATCVPKAASVKVTAYVCSDNQIFQVFSNGKRQLFEECVDDTPLCYQYTPEDESKVGFSVLAVCVAKLPGQTTPAVPAAPAGGPAEEVSVETEPTVECQTNPLVEGPEGYRWEADCYRSCSSNDGCPVNDQDPRVDSEDSNWCYGFIGGSKCMVLKYEGTTPAYYTPTDGSGYTTPERAPGSGVGATSPQQAGERTTVAFRFSENRDDLENIGWRPYTLGGVTVRYPFLNSTPGTKYIYAQFQDNQGNVINSVPIPASIELDKVEKSVEKTPAASLEQASCSSISISADTGYYATVKFSGTPKSLKIWVASNDDKDKSAENVGSWTPVRTVLNPTSAILYTLAYALEPKGFDKGRHAVLMSLHGSDEQMLDGNLNGVVNPSCATSIDIR